MSDNTIEMLAAAVHQHGAVSPQGLLERLFTLWFNGFVYNQIWEDPNVDLEALQLASDSSVLTISSGGCNVLNYLVLEPAAITAVDLNPYHIYLTRLKLVALERLPDYDSFFRFFASADDETNLNNYGTYIRAHLDDASREFWEGKTYFAKLFFRGRRIDYFSKNLYNYARNGSFLRFFHWFARAIGRDPARILSASSMAEQETIYNETIGPFFDNLLIRGISRLPLTLFGLGIPPQQYKSLSEEFPTGMIEVYRQRIKRLACGFPIDNNYFAWQAFSRRYDCVSRCALPEYLKEENYRILKESVGNVRTRICSVVDHLKSEPEGSFDRFVFLDAQDWMKPNQIEDLWKAIARAGRPGSRIIFRTGASGSPVEGSLSGRLRDRFRYERDLSLRLHKKDRAAIYGGFHVYALNN
jgi:S-adenosylmethionine-diacylglycerol 3-amino-3-carboxypropyl transferase